MELDTRGLKCPIPIIRLSAALKTLPVSGELTVVADDRGFPPTFAPGATRSATNWSRSSRATRREWSPSSVA